MLLSQVLGTSVITGREPEGFRHVPARLLELEVTHQIGFELGHGPDTRASFGRRPLRAIQLPGPLCNLQLNSCQTEMDLVVLAPQDLAAGALASFAPGAKTISDEREDAHDDSPYSISKERTAGPAGQEPRALHEFSAS